MKKWFAISLMVVLVCSIVAIDSYIHAKSYTKKQLQITALAHLPPQAAKFASIEFPNLLADYIFLNTLTFMGEKLIMKQQISKNDWDKVYAAFKVVTSLDPGASDAFTLAETTLPWEAGMVTETNQLLLRAAKHRPNDYHPYFFLWFNTYFFLKDPAQAALYLEKAARVPGSPSYFPNLAARMQVYGGRYELGIAFLQDSLQRAKEPGTIKIIKIRITALKQMYALEKAVQQYRKKYKKNPKELHDLVTAGLVAEIPPDPYGGKYYLLENGRVYTTSGLAFQQSETMRNKSIITKP